MFRLLPRLLRAQWQAFRDGSVIEELLEEGKPQALALVVMAGTVVLLGTAWLEPVASAARFRHPWLPVLILWMAGGVSFLFWYLKGQGNLSTVLTLLDTSLYVATVVVTVVLTDPPVSYGYATVLGIMLATAQSRAVSFTPIYALAVLTPSLGIVLAMGAGGVETVIVSASCGVGLWASYVTGQKRALARQNEGLRDALMASNKLVDDRMELGLSNLLLDLGNFLHELRNTQASMGASLDYIAHADPTDAEFREAVVDAVDGHNRVRALIERLFQDLKQRTTHQLVYFNIKDVLEDLRKEHGNGQALASLDGLPAFRLQGDPEHLRVALNNLIRNARQAGAVHVNVHARLESGASVLALTVEDDGPGMSADALASLFQPFFSIGKSSGSGLGLYSTKKRVELMGGSIKGQNSPNGGAVFTLRLPGRLLVEEVEVNAKGESGNVPQ